MATKYRNRETLGWIEDVQRNGYSGVTLTLRYREEGPKHTTYVTHKMTIDWCHMLNMTEKFHSIMAALKKELERAQARLRGEG